jgi:hypothetical protein
MRLRWLRLLLIGKGRDDMKTVIRKVFSYWGLLALALVAVTGVVAAAMRNRTVQVRPPHSMIAKQTAYDDAGNKYVSTIIRHVHEDGTCEDTQILWDGKVVHTTLHLTGNLTNRKATADMPSALGYKYFEENAPDVDTWISPDLQDYLKLVNKREDGSVRFMIEALEVSVP